MYLNTRAEIFKVLKTGYSGKAKASQSARKFINN